MGVEYRFRQATGLAIQTYYENFSHDFERVSSSTTNVSKGRYQYDLIALGIGYRLGTERFRWCSQGQVGYVLARYPIVVELLDDSFETGEKYEGGLAFRAGVIGEYYVSEALALTINPNFLVTSYTMFSDDRLQVLSVKIGFTAILW